MAVSRRVWHGAELGLLGLATSLLVLGARFAVQTAAVAVPPPSDDAPEPAAAVQPLETYAIIANRNIFAHEPGSAPTAVVALRGVGLGPGAPRAVVEDLATHEQRLVGLGETLADGTITAIEWNRITIRRPGGDLVLEVAPPTDAPPAPARTEPPDATPAAVSPGVRRTGANAFIVDRRALAGALDGMSGLVSQLRAVAEVQDGRPAGFRLFQMAEQSLFTQLGLQNGDVVQRVNGKGVSDPAALLGFLKQLHSEPRVALDIVRDGTARTLVYDLR